MAEHSPTPWRVVTDDDSDECDIYSAQGTPICTMSHLPDNPEADAALIVEAVNERDRLRDLVRRLVHQFEGRATYDDDAALLREAREAIGEDKP